MATTNDNGPRELLLAILLGLILALTLLWPTPGQAAVAGFTVMATVDRLSVPGNAIAFYRLGLDKNGSIVVSVDPSLPFATYLHRNVGKRVLVSMESR